MSWKNGAPEFLDLKENFCKNWSQIDSEPFLSNFCLLLSTFLDYFFCNLMDLFRFHFFAREAEISQIINTIQFLFCKLAAGRRMV